jgi:hypothetical protein
MRFSAYLLLFGTHWRLQSQLLKGVDLKALLPLVIADSLKGNMTTVAITLRFLDALLQAEGEQAIGEPGATASPCLKFLADRGAISQLVHSLDLEDNLTCDTLVVLLFYLLIVYLILLKEEFGVCECISCTRRKALLFNKCSTKCARRARFTSLWYTL